MTNTTNYDLILVEGSDKVNPLTQVNPNFEVIDEEMKKNKDAGVSTATELLTGSIHGLQRANADASMFRFTATSNYTSGDTFTVDGIQVTALTPTGEALGSGAYIIGSEVLCCLKGTLLTMFLSGGTVTTADNALKLGGQDPEYYGTAEDVTQAQQTATAAGVLANSVQVQVTELDSKITTQVISESEHYRLTKHGDIAVLALDGMTVSEWLPFVVPENCRPKYKSVRGVVEGISGNNNTHIPLLTIRSNGTTAGEYSTTYGGAVTQFSSVNTFRLFGTLTWSCE